jgi:hypothetical protein
MFKKWSMLVDAIVRLSYAADRHSRLLYLQAGLDPSSMESSMETREAAQKEPSLPLQSTGPSLGPSDLTLGHPLGLIAPVFEWGPDTIPMPVDPGTSTVGIDVATDLKSANFQRQDGGRRD